MAQYDVQHACGHEETHRLYGPHKDRARKIEWLETTDCGECRRAKQAAERAATSQQAADANAAAGLPALAGSGEQVAWAETIRRPVVDALTKARDAVVNRTMPDWLSQEAADEARQAVRMLADEIVTQTSARWWIDNRHRFGRGTIDGAPVMVWMQTQIRRRNLSPKMVAECDAHAASRKQQEGARS